MESKKTEPKHIEVPINESMFIGLVNGIGFTLEQIMPANLIEDQATFDALVIHMTMACLAELEESGVKVSEMVINEKFRELLKKHGLFLARLQ